VVSKEWNSQILVNLLVTSVARATGSNAKILELKHLYFPDTRSVSSDPPDGACVVRDWTDELLKQQEFVSDGGTTPPV
jgi:hypothetical protein